MTHTTFSALLPAWQAAMQQAWEAWQAHCIPIGAVILDGQGQIVSCSRNRINDEVGGPRQIVHNKLAHAEINAILELNDNQDSIHSFSIYTTMEPCPLCIGAIYMAGIRTIYYAARDAYAGSTDVLGKTPYYARKPVRVFGPDPALETVQIALQTAEYCERSQSTIWDSVINRWDEICPRGVAIGKKLAPWLRRQADADTSLAEVWNELAVFMKDPELL